MSPGRTELPSAPLSTGTGQHGNGEILHGRSFPLGKSRELPVRPWHLAPKEKDQSLGKLFPVLALQLINNVFLPQQPELLLHFIFIFHFFTPFL